MADSRKEWQGSVDDTKTFTIIVTVPDDSQREAFRFVSNALSDYIEKHEDLSPAGIHVSTPDGTESVAL